MIPVLQALKIAPDPVMRNAIVKSEQTCSIREGWRKYRRGPVMLGCELEPWAVMATIIKVRHRRLAEVTPKEWRKAGYSSRREMIHRLKRVYSNLRPNSRVTVIHWSDVQGKFVDNPGAHAEHLKMFAETGKVA